MTHISALRIQFVLLLFGSIACSSGQSLQLPRGKKSKSPEVQIPPSNDQSDPNVEFRDYGGPIHKIYGPQTPKLTCNGDNVKSITLPIDHSDPNSETFSYKYEHIVTNPAATTIVYIPGGPGQDAINTGDSPIPDGFNKIHIDPRGVGCNYYEDQLIPHFLFSTRNHAMDILAVVKELNITDYIIYGISYGTEAGTVAASLANEDPQMAAPKALVLEGVIGQAYDQGITQPRSMVKYWQRMLNEVPGLQELFLDDDNLPFGYDPFDWLDIVSEHMVFDPRDFKAAMELLVEEPDNPDLQAFYDSFFEGGPNDGPVSGNPGEAAFFEWVNCRELDPIITDSVYLTGGLMVLGTLPSEQYPCNGFALIYRYDSKDFPLGDTVVYYFQGNTDVLTDIEGARYHEAVTKERNQTYFVELDLAGHNPLGIELEDCNPEVWNAIANLANPATVLDANNNCPSGAALRAPGPSLRKKRYYR